MYIRKKILKYDWVYLCKRSPKHHIPTGSDQVQEMPLQLFDDKHKSVFARSKKFRSIWSRTKLKTRFVRENIYNSILDAKLNYITKLKNV